MPVEALIGKGDPKNPERGFHRLLAASAFHLGGFSARAFSLLTASIGNLNLSSIEHALALFIRRSFDQLERQIFEWIQDDTVSDEQLVSLVASVLETPDAQPADVDEAFLTAVDRALTQNFLRGIGAFLLALECGEDQLVGVAREELNRGFEVCKDLQPRTAMVVLPARHSSARRFVGRKFPHRDPAHAG